MPTGHYPRPTWKESLLARTIIDPITGCWETKTKAFRPHVAFKGNRPKIARLMAHLKFGMPLDSPLDVCHSCDNPCCYSPHHVFVDTRKGNMQDAVRKQRPLGWQNKTTDTQRRVIKQLYLEGEVLARIAARFEVSESTVYRIGNDSIQYQTYKDPKEPHG